VGVGVDKSVPFSMRVTPEFKRLLELAAAHERRSQTNLLEKLLFDHCRMSGLLSSASADKDKSAT
jgi:hypothetical protein